MAKPHTEMPRLSVMQRFIAINQSLWEQPDIDIVVWVWEYTGSGDSAAKCFDVPDGYVGGLLTPLIDGRRVDLVSFDNALADRGLTRTNILQSLALNGG